MLRRSLSALAVVCALSLPTPAGVIHQPGDSPDCPLTNTCSEPDPGGGTNSAAPSDPAVSVIWINGVPFIVIL